MKYSDEMNAKGLLRSNDDQTVAYAKPAYYALQNLASVFDSRLERIRNFKYEANISQSLSVFAYRNRDSKLGVVAIWLDGAAEAYTLLDEIKQAGVPVIIHPTMQRATGERENLSFETAAKLVKAGIPVALQSGYESYVPKTRVVLFEADFGLAIADVNQAGVMIDA